MADANYLNLKSKIQKRQKKKNRKSRFGLSFLTLVLLLCIIQISCSALLNFAKVISYQAKIRKAEQLKAEAEARNERLKSDIKNFSSMHKVESIARNNLKMAAKNEVLIIINQPAKNNEEEKEKSSENKFSKLLENFAAKFNSDINQDEAFE